MSLEPNPTRPLRGHPPLQAGEGGIGASSSTIGEAADPSSERGGYRAQRGGWGVSACLLNRTPPGRFAATLPCKQVREGLAPLQARSVKLRIPPRNGEGAERSEAG